MLLLQQVFFRFQVSSSSLSRAYLGKSSLLFFMHASKLSSSTTPAFFALSRRLQSFTGGLH